MAVQGLLGPRQTQWKVPAAALGLAALSGATMAVSPYFTVAAVVGLAVFLAIFFVPSRVLLFGFLLLTFSGFRPLPPILGFHIQAQYFLMVPLLLRTLGERSPDDPFRLPWQGLLRASALVLGVGIIALIQDLVAPGVSATTSIGDFVAWAVVYVFLWVFIRLVRHEGKDFARVLHRDLVDALGVFSAITVIGALLHFQSFQQAASARVTLADLHPNETGVLLDVAILLIVVPMIMRRARWRDGLWLLFMVPLLILTSSRESLAALVVGLFCILLFMRDIRSALRYFFALAALGVAVVILLIGNQTVVPHSLLRSMYVFPELVPYLTIFGFHLTPIVAERIYIQVSGFQQFLQHPWIGSGFNRGITITEGMNQPNWWDPTMILKVAHDSFITVAAQQGLLGLIPFVLLVLVALRIVKKATRITRPSGEDYDLAVAARVAVITLVFASFNIDALYTDFKISLVFFWVLVVAILVQQRPHPPAVKVPGPDAASAGLPLTPPVRQRVIGAARAATAPSLVALPRPPGQVKR